MRVSVGDLQLSSNSTRRSYFASEEGKRLLASKPFVFELGRANPRSTHPGIAPEFVARSYQPDTLKFAEWRVTEFPMSTPCILSPNSFGIFLISSPCFQVVP